MMKSILNGLFLLLLHYGTLLSTTCLAEENRNVYRLLIIDSQKGEPYQSVRESMLSELSRLGYQSGKNLILKQYSIGNKEGATRSIWDAESKNSYDVIFLNGTVAAAGFKKIAFGNMKYRFVFGAVTDPIGEGLIDAFDTPPKSNFTGVCYPVKVEDRLRFLRQLMPHAQKIGLIDAGMPQSRSYRRWLEDALKQPEFKDIEILFRSVEFVKSEEGHRRMTELAKKYVLELDPLVDVFLAPNDQMGVQQNFAEMVHQTASKPLIAVGKKEVTEGWGGAMALYPDQEEAGKTIAGMIHQIFSGQPIQSIPPRWPQGGYAFNLKKTRQFNLAIPSKLQENAKKKGATSEK